MQKLNQNSKTVIAINTIHSIIDLFINTFLVAYFLNLTHNDIVPTGLFYIANYGVVGLTFLLLGKVVKCGNKLFLYRMSFVVNAFLLMSVIYLKHHIIEFIWMLGIISGIEKALFFAPQNLIVSLETSKQTLLKFNGYREACAALAKIVMPFVLGWFISIDSFINTTIFILLLTLVEFVFSYGLRHLKTYSKPFKIKALLALVFRRPTIRLSLFIDFFNGFIFNVLDVLVVLYIVYIFKTDLNLGIFTSVFAIILTLTNWVFGRFCHLVSVKSLGLSGICGFAATAYFVFGISETSFIVYNIAFNSVIQFIRLAITSLIFRISQQKSVSSLYRAEYLVLREIALNGGRCMGFLFVIIAVLYGNQDSIKYFILILGLMIIALSYITAKLFVNLFEKENASC